MGWPGGGKGASRVGSVANRPALILDAARVGEGYWTAVGVALGSVFRRVIDKVLEATGDRKVGGGGGGQNWTLLEKLGGSGDLREA